VRTIIAGVATVGALLLIQGPLANARSERTEGSPASAALNVARAVAPATHAASVAPAVTPEQLTAVVQRTCVVCHNDQLQTGNLSLQNFAVEKADQNAVTAERMIQKLRAGMMPPPGMPRPGGDTMQALVETLETIVDASAAKVQGATDRPFQRLNRAEYESSVKEVLGLEIDAGDYLPLDTKSENFDNHADVQVLSPTLLDAYLNAAAEISRLAVGDPKAAPGDVNYEKSGYNSQWERVPGAPYGTRGGIAVVHNFPADGEYVFKLAFDHTTTGGFQGRGAQFERIEVSIDGEPVAVLDVDQWMTVADPNGVNMATEPVHVSAGPHQLAAAFVQRFEGPIEDLTVPHEWSLADREIGSNGNTGITQLPHVKDLTVSGPRNVTGVSDNPVRRRIFSCRPMSAAEERSCAGKIVRDLGTAAYRRQLTESDVVGLLKFYDLGVQEGGFEVGVRTALQAILASPDFVFRFERAAENIEPGESYRITDEALASRLSYFLWAAPPDQELIQLAAQKKLSNSRTLEQQVRRMLADPRSEALATRFAAQWLRLADMDLIHPDANLFPDFTQQIADDMRRETELFFHNLVKQDRSVLELYSADYTFLNERLARHYGITGVIGPDFREVKYPDATRRGVLGHGSILTLTSIAARTSPVLRGKYVMEVIIGTPPPPPPPGVPDLAQTTTGGGDGQILTTRQRMELHRAAPVCRACHQFMDPIGLSLDNFDVIGKWRVRENGTPLDTRGMLYDGTPVSSPGELQAALLKYRVALVRTFTKNMMSYALGRRIEPHDMPAVRSIVSAAEQNDFKMSSFIMGVVETDQFRMKASPAVTETAQGNR
jgi:cytochrome c5